MRILIVEDDLPLSSFLRKGLEAEAYVVDAESDGIVATARCKELKYDLLILDLNLPSQDGTVVLKEARQLDPDLPVLVLTARSTVEERVKVLDLGADDYLVKPFSYSELAARVRALLRRKGRPPDILIRSYDVELDPLQRKVRRAGQDIELSWKEFALLEYLMKHSDHTVTRTMILQNVWKAEGESLTNVVDVYINYLRRKIEGTATLRLIHTIRGVGYRFGNKPIDTEEQHERFT